MKLFRNLVIGFSVAAFFVSFAVLSSADWGQNKMCNAGTVKTLRDSAAALQTTNPDLSKALTALADQHEAMMMKKKAWHADKIKMVRDSAVALQTSNAVLAKGLNEYADREMKETEGTEMAEMKENNAADIKLFRDSAVALQTTHPDLSNKLTMCASKKEMKGKWMKDEAEETTETAAEQKEMEMN